jgi:hypothetical protein
VQADLEIMGLQVVTRVDQQSTEPENTVTAVDEGRFTEGDRITVQYSDGGNGDDDEGGNAAGGGEGRRTGDRSIGGGAGDEGGDR